MDRIRTFQDLTVWRKSHQLVLDVYRASRKFPSEEQFALTSQLRRAVVSITFNIAEGFCRQTKRDKINFYHISLGSCAEVQNQIIIARDLEYLDTDHYASIFDLSVEVHKMLNALIKSLRTEN